MKGITDKTSSVMYSVKLSSVTRRGQLKEIVRTIKFKYPEETDEKDIYFSRKREDGTYVYIIHDSDKRDYISRELYTKNRLISDASDEEILKGYKAKDIVRNYRKADDVKKAICCLLVFIAVVCVFLLATGESRARKEALRFERNRILREEQLRIDKEKKLIETINILEDEYKTLSQNTFSDKYSVIMNIALSLKEDGTIEVLSITDNNVYVQIETNDYVALYERFLKNAFFSDVVMESAIRTGDKFKTVFRMIVANTNNLQYPQNIQVTSDKKIAFIKEKIRNIRKRTEKVPITENEYLHHIRVDLIKYNLKEESVENKEKGELRFTITGNGNDVISFIRDSFIKDDISTFYASCDGLNITCRITLQRTFIPSEKDVVEAKEEWEKNVFKAKKKDVKEREEAKEYLKNYAVIGKAAKGDKKFVVFKDLTDGKLYRFEEKDTSDEDGTCVYSKSGEYRLRINGKEVYVK